eukprot:CAMPEP_0119047896 /NCGR_PEP_ID=MMETSP1177-20130426/55670_1 /TAXON_ID=2985 /ORGANISM="Ochromonas sp, Strain CCMP1899" /LENGTH=396 /DNA_ID=CAMNT_0007023055 /DNA_START=233 /DNA_END=1423 /DNA_ORIENTATION=+
MNISNYNDFENLDKLLSAAQTLNYDEFISYCDKCPESIQRYFTAQYFLMLPKDKTGAITSEAFLRFVQRSIDVENTCLQLIKYAKGKDSAMGFINELELERFILGRIPDISACDDLPESFHPYYVFTASRRFLFFLDSRRTRRIRVKKLAHSAVMEEMLFLQRISRHEEEIDRKTFTNQVNNNWFSGSNALRVFSIYVELDKDQNGMLSQEELLAFTGLSNESVQLSATAVKRLFEENITYQPMEMDYKAFLDLLLALEYRATVESMSYFWRVLDLDKSGRLTPAAIKFFYADIYESLKSTGYEAPLVDNIVMEIYDILACNDPKGPSFQDLINSDQGHTVISMLLDVTGFWQYDNRESLMQQNGGNTELEAEDDDDDEYAYYQSKNEDEGKDHGS